MMQKDKVIAFVCTGNTCRSPMAEGIFNKLASDRGLDVRAVSFGMAAANGVPATQHAVTVCSEIDVDISRKKAHFIYSFDVNSIDRFYCMSEDHKMMLMECCDIPPEKIRVLSIPDPYWGNIDVYRRCRDEIYNSVKEIIKEYEN